MGRCVRDAPTRQAGRVCAENEGIVSDDGMKGGQGWRMTATAAAASLSVLLILRRGGGSSSSSQRHAHSVTPRQTAALPSPPPSSSLSAFSKDGDCPHHHHQQQASPSRPVLPPPPGPFLFPKNRNRGARNHPDITPQGFGASFPGGGGEERRMDGRRPPPRRRCADVSARAWCISRSEFFFSSPTAGRQSKMKNAWSHPSTLIPCTCLEV